MFKTTIIRTSSLVKILLIYIAAVAVVGCATDPHVAEQISHAEAIAMEKPDSALIIMRSIDPSLVRGRHDNAHYNLVYSESLYYNAIDSDNDSITRPMVEYYMSSDNHAERARAMYQHAQVMMTAGEYAESMIYCMEAEQSLAHLDNPRLLGLVHRNKGVIYIDGCLYSNALEEFISAKRCFEQAGLEYHTNYSDYDIGRCYYGLRDYANAVEYLTSSLKYSVSIGASDIASMFLFNLLNTYFAMREFDNYSELVDCFDAEININKDLYYLYQAIVNVSNGNVTEAINNLKYSEESGCDTYLLSYASYYVYRKIGDSKKALKFFEDCIIYQNEIVIAALDAPILNLQIELGLQKQKELQMRNENVKLRLITIIVLIILFIMMLVTYFYRRDVNYRQKIEEYIATIKDLHAESHGISLEVKKHTNLLYKSRLSELNKLCDIYYDGEGSSKQTKMVYDELVKIINSIKNDKKYINELENIVNQYYDNIISDLYEQCPKLNARQKRLALYLLSGFSLRAIAIFMDSNPIQISKDKYKLKKTIAESNLVNKERVYDLI